MLNPNPPDDYEKRDIAMAHKAQYKSKAKKKKKRKAIKKKILALLKKL